MDAIHKGRVITHLTWERSKKMSDTLLVLDVDIKVPDHDNTAICTNAFLATAELARLHITLHDVYAIFLIERNTGDFIKADDIVLANQAPLSVGVVDEHPSDCCFAA